jgi:NADH-quinone oxidoreductase subunit D
MTYAWIDGPLGVSGCLLVGSGAKYPWRMKIRSASFATMQALPRTLPGTPFEQLAEAVMSFPMVMGDVDR